MENLSAFEKVCMDELHLQLVANFNNDMFAIGNNVDSAACILKEDNHWYVFDGCRGSRCDEKKFDNPVLACLEELSRVSMTDDEGNRLKTEFLNVVYEPNRAKMASSVA